MVMTVSWRKGVNLWSFACQHRGVLTEDFERTRAILRGNDEGLLAHVGADLQCGFNRFSRSVPAATVSPTHARRISASAAQYAAVMPRSPISISATPVSPIRAASRQN